MQPKVSIIVPGFNGARTMRACLQSIVSLDPASPPHEIIVADNGSTDGTVDIIRSFPQVRFFEEHQARGGSAARNAGAREARGEFLAFTDQDCIVPGNWLIAGLRGFTVDDIVIVGGPIRGVPARSLVQAWMNSRRILDPEWIMAKAVRPYIQTANAFFRRKPFFAVGGFDNDIPFGGDDSDLSWRILDAGGGHLGFVDDCVVLHDHRCTIRGMLRQAYKNAQSGAYLRMKWGDGLPRKRWETGAYECYDLMRSVGRWVLCPGAEDRLMAGLDVLHRLGRKCGMIRAAWKTRQWSEW